MYKLAYYENIVRGTMDFPVAYYFVDEKHARYNMPTHWHKEWEVIRVCRGELTLFADEAQFQAKEGDCFLLSEGVMHRGIPKDCVYECLVFDLHSCYRDIPMVKKYLRPFYRGQLVPTMFFPAEHSLISGIMGDLMAAMHSSCAELAFLAQLSRLLTVISEQTLYVPSNEQKNTGSQRISPLKPVLEYIESNYSQPISLDLLSEIAGMNPKYFCRFFASITGQTPMDYVNSYRIDQAALLLESGELSVTQVGLSCGFSDTSYFIKCFRKFRDRTPRQYQKETLSLM